MGDPYSLGGNGAAIPHDGPVIAPPPGIKAPTIQLPSGLGGGPVTEGPFANMTITLGPVALTDVPPGPMGGLGHNPRPSKRDLAKQKGNKSILQRVRPIWERTITHTSLGGTSLPARLLALMTC